MPQLLVPSLVVLAATLHLLRQDEPRPELPLPVRVEREGAARGGELGSVVALEEALPELRGAPDESLALDLLATRPTFVGDDEGALALDHEGALVRDDEAHGRARGYAGAEADALAGLEAREAVVWIVGAARQRRVGMRNEEHRSSRQRAFAHTVLGGLRDAGFTHLALETLTTDPARLERSNARRAPLESDGFYARDPLLGDPMRPGLVLVARLVEPDGEVPVERALE